MSELHAIIYAATAKGYRVDIRYIDVPKVTKDGTIKAYWIGASNEKELVAFPIVVPDLSDQSLRDYLTSLPWPPSTKSSPWALL